MAGFENLSLITGSGDDQIVADCAIESYSVQSGTGDDKITGSYAQGSAFAGSGDAILISGAGFEFLYGGAGADRFVFTGDLIASDPARDHLGDSESGVDTVELGNLVVTEIDVGTNSGNGTVCAGYHLRWRSESLFSHLDHRSRLCARSLWHGGP